MTLRNSLLPACWQRELGVKRGEWRLGRAVKHRAAQEQCGSEGEEDGFRDSKENARTSATGQQLRWAPRAPEILRAVDRAREHLPLQAVLRFLRVSPSRFHA